MLLIGDLSNIPEKKPETSKDKDVKYLNGSELDEILDDVEYYTKVIRQREENNDPVDVEMYSILANAYFDLADKAFEVNDLKLVDQCYLSGRNVLLSQAYIENKKNLSNKTLEQELEITEKREKNIYEKICAATEHVDMGGQ